MKRGILRSLVSRSEWRSGSVSLALVIVIWFCCYPIAAQVQTTRRVTTMRADNDSQGSKVTVLSDKTLSDYEAYRRGDRFYVKVPSARLQGGKPNLRGKGFDDVTVQRLGGDVILSFRLQPGTAAKVNQRTNGLDVIFSTSGASQAASNPPAQVPGTSGAQAPATEVAEPTRPSDSLGSGAASGAAQATPTALTPVQDPVSQKSVSPQVPVTPEDEKVAGEGSDSSKNRVNNAAIETATPSTLSGSNAQPPSAVERDSPTTGADKRGVFNGSWSGRLIVLSTLLVLVGLALLIARRRRRKQQDLSDNAISILPSSSNTQAVVPPEVSPEVPKNHSDSSSLSLLRSAGIDLELNKMLAGHEYDAVLIDVADPATRQAIAEQLLATLSGPAVEQHKAARRAFFSYGYFGELVAQLRSSDDAELRAIAATKLGCVGDSQVTSHLIEALNDSAPEVRRAVVESLRRLADPDLMASLSDLLSRERNRQLSSSLIKEAIQASGSRTAGKIEASKSDQTEIAKVAAASGCQSSESYTEILPANPDES